MELIAGEPITEKNALPLTAHVTAVIGFAGYYRGGMGIYLPRALALKMVAAMLGVPVDQVTIDKMPADVKDAIGEIVNIIAGGAKAELSKQGITFDLSLPTVIVGEKFQVYVDNNPERVQAVIPFTAGEDQLFVECNIEKTNK